MKSANNILLVRVPAQGAADGRDLRDHVLESLSRGVLVLTEDTTCEVMELPPLGGVEIEPSKPLEPSQKGLLIQEISQSSEAEETGAESPTVVISGRNMEEKRAILERLQQYRETHGLGCWRDVAKQAGGGITEETIRAIYTGEECLPIAGWRMIDRAMKSLSEKAAAPC